jgi:hypothetical protein
MSDPGSGSRSDGTRLSIASLTALIAATNG